MKYKVVKNSEGKIVAFGLDDGNYDPTIKDGETLSLQDNQPVLDTTDADAKAAKRLEAIAKLGLSADEAAALFG